MERQEQIKNIKALESEYLSSMETVIRQKYLNILFEKYKESIKKISQCYADPNLNLSKSVECSNEAVAKYHEREKKFEDLLKHYEVKIFEIILKQYLLEFYWRMHQTLSFRYKKSGKNLGFSIVYLFFKDIGLL